MAKKKDGSVRLTPPPKVPPLVASGILSMSIGVGCRTDEASTVREAKDVVVPPQPVPQDRFQIAEALNALATQSPFRSIQELARELGVNSFQLIFFLRNPELGTMLTPEAHRLVGTLGPVHIPPQPPQPHPTERGDDVVPPQPVPPQPHPDPPDPDERLADRVNLLAASSPFRSLDALSQSAGVSAATLTQYLGSDEFQNLLSEDARQLTDGLASQVIVPPQPHPDPVPPQPVPADD